jgi:hypothetical protein
MANPDINSVLRSQEFYRLKTEVTSSGDIFEVDVSSKAMFIGPDSDIAEVRVQYADQDAPLGVQTADVSVNGPFVGGMTVDMTATIPSTGQPSRILVTPVDLIDATYERFTSPAFAPLRRFNMPVVLDLMVALQDLQAIPAVRADRTYRFPQTPYEPGNLGSTDIVIPIYGRRMITCQFVTQEEYLASFYLVALQPSGIVARPHNIGSIEQLLGADPLTQAVVIKASEHIEFVSGTTSVPTTYTESADPLPSVKGVADLLVINLSSGSGIPGLKFLDLFVKLSDRES